MNWLRLPTVACLQEDEIFEIIELYVYPVIVKILLWVIIYNTANIIEIKHPLFKTNTCTIITAY